MLSSPRRFRAVFGSLTVGALFCVAPIAKGQVSFYGAPAPAPVMQDEGGNETEPEGAGDVAGAFLGKLPVSFNIAVREGFDSNVNTTKDDPDQSWYTNFAAGMSYGFGTPRLQLGLTLGGGITWYYSRPDDPVDYNFNLGASATYLATPRLTLSLSTNTSYLSQPDITIVGGTNHQDGDYFYTNTMLSAAYQWSDVISTITSYNFTAFYYADSSLNQNQGNISQTVAQSVNWLWRPKTTLVAEYRINAISYYQADLNQIGNYFLVGFDQIFNPKFFWNVRAGAQVNFNNNPVDGESVYVGPFLESTLRYQYAPASSVGWNTRYGTETSGINDVTQRQTFRTGVIVTHTFTPRLSATAEANYNISYYQQEDVIDTFTENVINFSLGLNYKLTRLLSLQAGYQYTIDIAPNDPNREYTRSIAFLGANLAF